MSPLISICIPAYKRASFLRRLLESIQTQDWKDFEVIVTDDSPDEEVSRLVDQFRERYSIQYQKNDPSLGTPENWNAALRLARGEWIKLMHDDDWFKNSRSLSVFAAAAKAHPGADFIFSAYTNVFLEKNSGEDVHATATRLKQLALNPVTLFSSNVVGPPSVVMHRNQPGIYYDAKLKWVVDIDFYIRFLENRSFHYIDQPLVNVGISSEQVTQDCFRQRQVEIPETFHMFNKTGWQHLHHILVYDGWWRLLRNLEIRKNRDIPESGYAGEVPHVVQSMIRWQSRFPLWLLRRGVISKSLMFLHYIAHKKRLS